MAKPAESPSAYLAPGVSYFQVLEPSPVPSADGGQQFAMVGPFLELFAANSYASTRPGSLISVTLILHQIPAAAPPAAPVR